MRDDGEDGEEGQDEMPEVASELVPTLTRKEAEAAMMRKLRRRYSKLESGELASQATERWEKLQRAGRRMWEDTCDLGIVLAAIREDAKKPGAPGYRQVLNQLGISVMSAQRWRELAVIRELLPKNPPPELFGTMWTDSSALQFGRAMLELEDDIPDGGDRVKAATARLQKKRQQRASTEHASQALKLEHAITLALQQGDPGALAGVDAIKGVARRLDRIARDIAGEDYDADVIDA